MGKGKGKGKGNAELAGAQSHPGSGSHPHHVSVTGPHLSSGASTTHPVTTTNIPARCTPVPFSASNSIPANTTCSGQTITLFNFPTPFQNIVAAQFTVPVAGPGHNACPVAFRITFSNGTVQNVPAVTPGTSTIVNVPGNLSVSKVEAICSPASTPPTECGGTATLFFTVCV